MSGIKGARGAVPLHKSTAEANAVSWSQDQRIAVTSSQTIYILTLKHPQFSQRGNVSTAHSPEALQSNEGNPLLVISTAQSPLREKLAPLNMEGVSRGSVSTCPPAAQWNLMDFVDPLLVGDPTQSHDLFKSSYWSPAGYSHLGGCVLTTLTASGRLLLFTPPGNTGNTWRLALDVSAHHSALLWPSKPQNKKGKSTKGSSKGGNGSQPAAEGINGIDSTPPPRPKRARLSTGLSEEYRQRRLSMACTAGAWLPTLLLVNCEVIGVIAVATRTGHVTLLGVKLPIVLDKMKEDPVSLICDYQLPLACEGEESAWACSLAWLPSSSITQTTPTFYTSQSTEGHAHAQLVVGCTNGQVCNMTWELSGVNGIVGLVSNSVSCLTGVCSISGVTGVTARVSDVGYLWEEADGVPVCCLASQSKFSADGFLWVLFSKSSLLMGHCVDASYSPLGEEGSRLEISGHHKMTVSGLAAYSGSSFISAAQDGSLQTFTLDYDLATSHVTPNPIAIETKGKGSGMRAQGVAVSEMGVFAAVSINLPENTRVRSSKLRMQAQLHFVTISSPGEVEDMIKGEASSKWDVCEHVRRNYLQHHTFLPAVQELITHRSKGRVISIPKLQLLLQASIVKAEREAISHCREGIIHKHLVASMKSWLEWDKRSPSGSEPSAQEVDPQSQFCIHLMVRWILKHLSGQETKLANKVLITLGSLSPPSAAPTHKKSHHKVKPHPSRSQLELCPACGEEVPLTDLQQDSCCHGHTWSRCSLTLCLAADSRCSSCMQCGAIVNNALTITMETGSWLNSLLQENSCCIFCGGYFEQVI